MDRVRHKLSNRFKFQSFSERISNINIDVFHRIPHRYEEETGEESSTYFNQAVQKWATLNLTENFKLFRQEVGYEINTLPQLINNKEKIVEVFLKHISLQNMLSIQPVLEILVAFVKDIRYEFYQFYPRILKELISLLKVRDPEILESTFTCLAYLFKYLTRELVKDFDKVLVDLAPLLNDENPIYVRNFAAHSFAFVARKVKDKEKFLLLILQTIQSSPHLLNGSSQLIFHMLLGIKGQSHSCADDILFTLFNSFGNSAIPQKLLFELSSNIVSSYGNSVLSQHSVLFTVLIKVLLDKIEKDGPSSKSVKNLLKIFKVGLESRSGANLQESLIPQVTQILTKLLLSDDKVKKLSAIICGDLLTLSKLKIPQEIASLLVIKVIETKDEEVLIDFMHQVRNFSGFETLVLPKVLHVFCLIRSKKFLEYLAKIILEKLVPVSGSYNILETPTYPITLGSTTQKLKDTIMDPVKEFDVKTEWTNDVLYSLIIMRHVTPLSASEVVENLTNILKKVVKHLKMVPETDTYLLLLCTILETMQYYRDEIDRENLDSVFSDFLSIALKNMSILSLRAVNLMLIISGGIDVSDELYSDVYKSVEKLTQSAHSYLRFLALHTLQCLEKLKGSNSDVKGMGEALQLCLNAEVISLTINDYREKIKELEKLKYDALPNLTDQNYQVIIRYLLGALHCNFQLLWDPISEILASYAIRMPKGFWSIFHNQLIFVTEVCKDKKPPNDYRLPNLDDFLLQSVRLIKVDDKADYNNYRYLIWKAMTLFVDLSESKNRDVVTLYLSFLKDELLKSSPQDNQTINIKLNETKDEVEVDVDVEEEEEEEEEGKLNEREKISKKDVVSVKSGPSFVIKWAVAHLSLLSKFKSPKLCYKESDLRASYFDLLNHRNLEIQKLALECLYTFKFKYMTPYINNLRNLVDDNKFRDEIVHFQIDKENGVVKENHREELMPLVMRILYNKMMSKTAVKRGSKGSAALLKRSTVFRFLAGCSESEMEVFLHMAFKNFDSHQEADSVGFEKIVNSVDLEHITSPTKLQSVINLADVILEHFGGLMSESLQRYILKILFSVGALISGIFSQRDKVFSGYMTSIKNLRGSNADCLAKFFHRLSFPWTEDEIDTVFNIFVWPGLEKLPMEGVYNPTATLRLFAIWADNPRYYKLLAKYKPGDQTLTPLPYVMKLLLSDKCQSSVTACITSILDKLLTLKEEGDDEVEPEPPLDVSNVLPVDETQLDKLTLKDELNYGSKILLPHVGSILTFLRRKLEKSSNSLQKIELGILSRVTELATSPENSDSLMTLLVRLLTVRKPTDDEILTNTITTVENLAKIVNKPMSYVKPLAVLLDSFDAMETRRILISALLNIQERCPELNQCVDLIRDLNSYDSKWVNQPDFETRLDAYKKIRNLALENKVDANLGIMVLYHCFFVIRSDTDLSLRDSASYCLKEICPIISKNWKDNRPQNQFWIDSILKLIHKSIIGKDENLQDFAISLLGVMARECGDLHPVLGDLSVYSNKTDLEVDFFENAVHLQTHRRLRSLLRFCSLCKTLTKPPNTRTLVQFILPIATRYLCNEKYTGKNTLIDSAILCLGSVCRFLPWQKYQTVLRYYLSKFQGKIEFQRQLVRVVIAILDSFHFDISKAGDATVKNRTAPKETKVEEMNVESKEKDGEEKAKESSAEESVLLNELHEEEDEVEVVETANKKEEVPSEPAFKVVTILKPEEAARVERTLSGSLLAQLTKAIGQKSQMEDTHKTNYKSLGPERDQEDVVRIPIAVTLVKLLQKISKKMLDDNLPGILMKLCTFLKSKMESVRRATRETMQQIIVSLGPKYLPVMFSEITAVLTKGFQLHVLIFTMHAVIQSVKEQLQPGDIDVNLSTLLPICKSDIFGLQSEEKEVKQIQVKHKEVRSTKSYRLMNIIAENITGKCLTDLLMPIKEMLLTTHSHKTITKCRECLRHIIVGLCANEFVSIENLFIYVYGIVSESIPKLFAPEGPVEEKKKPIKERRDCYIIPPEPKSRTGVLSNPVKKASKSNAHILLEFGFQLMQFLLKKEKLKSVTDFRSYLDPIGPILVKAVESQHVKVSTLALNCLCKLFKYDLPSVRNELKTVMRELFAILHKYAAPGLSKGEAFDLVLVAFKAICVALRDTKYDGLDVDQLKILLVYVEQDMYDNGRQASAFNLLKTILRKKLKSPELFDLMKKVAELSISSDLPHVRVQSRQAAFQYIMDYPLNKDQLEYFIGFYISQLSFELETGRQSALEMIHSFITSFPQKVLNEQCNVFLITLGARLINDDSPDCKKAVSGILKSMLTRLDEEHRTQLFELLLLWLKQKKVNHQRLAAQLAGIFAAMEKSDFEKRLPGLIPVLEMQFSGDSKPGRYVRLTTKKEELNQGRDYHIFQVLQLLLKICSQCSNFLTDPAYQESIHLFTETCHSFLCHPHEWVRLASMQFFSCLFHAIEPGKVAAVLNGEKTKTDLSFLESSSLRRRIRSLILDHVTQLIPGVDVGAEFIDQTTKNLVYFSRVLKDLKETEVVKKEKDEEEEEEEETEDGKKLSLLWLIRKMRGIVNKEIAEAPLSYTLRSGIYKWIGAVTVCLTREELSPVLYHLMAPIVRERDLVEGENNQSPVKSLVMDVTKLLKKKVGVDEYTKESVKIRKKLMERRTLRKTQRAQEFVINPERAAKRKMEKQQKKKEHKRRKIEALKGKGLKRFHRKRKLSEDEFM